VLAGTPPKVQREALEHFRDRAELAT